MPVTPTWQEISSRLVLTVVAGLIIGFNRGEHGRPAGLRTTLLVCLTASLSMIQANLLMNSVGKTHDSFIVLDLMRLPLGVLSGMGFIGAGAILRKENMVLGVTTAATLWFTTMVGLCFGGGQIAIGLAALGLGCGILRGLKFIERLMRQDVRASFSVSIPAGTDLEENIRKLIRDSGWTVLACAIEFEQKTSRLEFRYDLRWHAPPGETPPPPFVAALSSDPRTERLEWHPQAAALR